MPEFLTIHNKPIVAQNHALTRAIKQIQRFENEDNYQVGQMVRLKMSSIFNNVRKLVKDNMTKQIVVTYSPVLYKIQKLITPRNGLLERKRYVLEKENGDVVTSAKGKQKDFYASELEHADNATPSHITMEQALKLNQVEPNKHDLLY